VTLWTLDIGLWTAMVKNMGVTEVREKIKAGVVFGKGVPQPKWFMWKGKRIDVKEVTYTWNTMEGEAVLLHFAAAAETGTYELSFNQKTLEWILEKTEVE
jgi:hypothetical protein